ncbi:MAG: signal peptidase II [Patescibacteria group bacterium]
MSVRLDPPRGFGAVAAGVVLADQLTKWLVAGQGTVLIAPPLRLGAVYNREGVLGLPIDNGVLLLAGVAISAFLGYRLTRSVRPEVRAGFWLLLAGAASNTLDRVQYDGVLDIVAIGPTAHFNVADLSIIAGAVILITVLWRRGADKGRDG